jgi:phosphate starvation-inducible protein PhoH
MKDKKKDQSPKITQREKIKDSLSIRSLNWTAKQKEFIDLATNKDTRVIFINGPAGTSKSIIATYVSLLLLNDKRVSDIIYIRSAVESSDSKIGYLPGDADEKLHYYNLPFLEKLDELLPRAEVDKLEKDERISMYPVNYSRGMSWAAKAIIFDEAQNSTSKEIITVLTRLGEFSRCFVLADPMQTDLPQNKAGGFEKLFTLFSDEESKMHGIHTFCFTEEDIVRSKIVKFMVNKLKNLK